MKIKVNKQNTMRQKKKEKGPPENETNVHINIIEFVLCSPNAPGMEAACSVHNIPSGTLLRKVIFLDQQVSIVDSFLVWLGILCPTTHAPRSRTLSGLNMNSSCVYCHSLCEFTCTSILLCLTDSFFLKLCFNSISYKHSASLA